jgi:hypothetical protein
MTDEKKIKDLERVIARQKRFTADAEQDARDNEKARQDALRKGQLESAKDSAWEVNVCKVFAEKRKKIVADAQQKLAKIKPTTKISKK